VIRGLSFVSLPVRWSQGDQIRSPNGSDPRGDRKAGAMSVSRAGRYCGSLIETRDYSATVKCRDARLTILLLFPM